MQEENKCVAYAHYYYKDVEKIILNLNEHNKLLAKPNKDVEICIELLKVVERILKNED